MTAGDIYAQRLSSDGTRPAPWPAAGVVLCNATDSQETPVLCSDGGGGAIVAWADLRQRATNEDDVYATRVDGNGVVAGVLDVASESLSGPDLKIEPNPSLASVRFRIRLKGASVVELAVMDIRGRRIRVVSFGEQPSGDRVFVWDGLDARGQKPSPGVYLAAWTINGQRSCRRMVLLN